MKPAKYLVLILALTLAGGASAQIVTKVPPPLMDATTTDAHYVVGYYDSKLTKLYVQNLDQLLQGASNGKFLLKFSADRTQSQVGLTDAKGNLTYGPWIPVVRMTIVVLAARTATAGDIRYHINGALVTTQAAIGAAQSNSSSQNTGNPTTYPANPEYVSFNGPGTVWGQEVAQNITCTYTYSGAHKTYVGASNYGLGFAVSVGAWPTP